MSDLVEVEIELPTDVMFELMLMAHKQNITFNQLVNNILREHLDKIAVETPTQGQ